MVHLMENEKDVTAHGSLDGLLYGISLGKEDGTVLGYSVRV